MPIIRRVIRRHANEVKGCYDQQLVSNPTLAGKVMVQFTIAGSGRDRIDAATAMNDPRVESCTVEAARRWHFLKPLCGGSLGFLSFVLVPVPTPFLGAWHAAGWSRSAPSMTSSVRPTRRTRTVSAANGMIAKTERGLLLIDTGWTEPADGGNLDLGRTEAQTPMDRRGDHPRPR